MENSSVRKYKLANIQRKCVVDAFPLKNLGRNVQFVVANEEDTDVIRKFLDDEFVDQEPMNKSIELTRDDFAVFIGPTLEESKSQNLTLLVVDDGFLCGLFINNAHKVERTGKWKNTQMKEDYGEEFDANKTSSEKFKKISVMLDEVGSFVAQNLPEDVNDYVRLDVLNVHRDYARNGLAKKLTLESAKWAYKLGYKFGHITGSSVGTNHIARGFEFTEIFSIELSKFYTHGKQIFPDEFYDGGRYITSYVINLMEFIEKYG